MKINLKKIGKQAKRAVGQLEKQVKPAVQNLIKDPKKLQSLASGAQNIIKGGRLDFGNLRNQLRPNLPTPPGMGGKGMGMGPAKQPAMQPGLPPAQTSQAQPTTAAPKIGENAESLPKPKAAVSPLSPKPLIEEKSPIQPPLAPSTQVKAVGPAQQEQEMKNQLMPPAGQPPQMGQPPQEAAAPAQDNSALDQQITALQKQIADLQAQKK